MPETYLCADCGATYDKKDPPCRQCAGERFAILDTTDHVPDRIKGAIDLAWRCTGCGKTQVRNNPPCDACGTLEYEAVYDDAAEPAAVSESTSAPADSWNWVNPPGPFRGIRKWLLRGILLLTALVGVLFVAAPLWGGNAGALVIVYLIFVLPELLIVLGIAWLVDMVVGYLKHG